MYGQYLSIDTQNEEASKNLLKKKCNKNIKCKKDDSLLDFLTTSSNFQHKIFQKISACLEILY